MLWGVSFSVEAVVSARVAAALAATMLPMPSDGAMVRRLGSDVQPEGNMVREPREARDPSTR